MITGVSPLRAQPVAQAVKSGPVKGSLRLSGRADRQPHNRPSKLVRADPPDRADFAQELEDFDKVGEPERCEYYLARAAEQMQCHKPQLSPLRLQEFVGLLPDEDHEVPGGYTDSLSQNTKLGRAVNDACLELDALGKLVRTETLCSCVQRYTIQSCRTHPCWNCRRRRIWRKLTTFYGS